MQCITKPRLQFAILTLALFILTLTNSCRTASPATPADLVLRGGRIVTLDEKIPEAQALAASGGKIVAVGSDADVAAYIGPSTQVIDLAGQLAIPGFTERHGHFTGVGENRVNLDFMTTMSWDQIVQMVAKAAAAAKPGEWIVGRGWHQSKWTSAPEQNVEGFPLHGSLDKVSPDNPVVLTHASGHAAFVNMKAMEISGIDRNTKNPVAARSSKIKPEIQPGCCGRRRSDW